MSEVFNQSINQSKTLFCFEFRDRKYDPKKMKLICKIKTKKIHIIGKFIKIRSTNDFKK